MISSYAEITRSRTVTMVSMASSVWLMAVTTSTMSPREKLSRHLIGHPLRLQQLEAIVHPLVRARIRSFLADAAARGEPMAVVDIPLLFENGVDWGLDAIVVTTVNEAEQRRRALARPGMTVEKLEAILARQMPQAEKVKRATYIIDTSGTIGATQQAVAELVQRLEEAQAR